MPTRKPFDGRLCTLVSDGGFAAMKDLVAIVTVRRLLLELGYALAPEDIHGRIGPLSLWISQPRPDLGGHSPMSALAQPGGEDLLRQCLARLVADSHGPSSPAQASGSPSSD
ncbi:MAG: hypothetical protein AB7K71_33825 [Polyangiaceae bacterium]